jgi:catechol 1,2-dioxygenase
VAGRVVDVHGASVPGAALEIWQADHCGLYDLDGYRYRTRLAPPPAGTYGFETVMPGHYPARVARHVHYFVTAPGYEPLTTQLYFATDEVFEGDPDRHFTKDPLITSRTLVRPVTLSGQPEAARASVEFELVLEKAAR